LSANIFYDDTDFRLKGWGKVKKLLVKVISEEGKVSGDLNFIITNDEELKKINVEFLQHNYFTDVISFDNSTDEKISGEVYISIDTVRNNSVNYKVSLTNEIIRVIVHGTLHLCGYSDNTDEERAIMRKREDGWIEIYDSL
jgi:probable rRNA maturation factor